MFVNTPVHTHIMRFYDLNSNPCNIKYIIIIASAETCQTKAKGPCVFPFKSKGITYNSCTEAEGYDGKPWCAYEVKGNGDWKNWDYCEKKDGCPGKKCVIAISM